MNTDEALNRLEFLGDRLLKPEDASPFLGKTPGTLAVIRHKKRGCPYVQDNRAIYYRASDIAEYIKARRVIPAAA